MYTLFGVGGRIGRGGWWLGQAALLGFAFLFLLLPTLKGAPLSANISRDMSLSDIEQIARAWSPHEVTIFAAVYAWIWLAVTSKRLHDLGRSGIWAMIGLLPGGLALWHFYYCPGCSGDFTSQQMVAYLGLADYIIGPAFLIYCGKFRGKEAENQYGPPPGTARRTQAAGEEAPSKSKFARLDDDYLEAYARAYAQEQAKDPPAALEAATHTPRPSFGKR